MLFVIPFVLLVLAGSIISGLTLAPTVLCIITGVMLAASIAGFRHGSRHDAVSGSMGYLVGFVMTVGMAAVWIAHLAGGV